MRGRLAVFTLAVAGLIVSACSPSGTDDPAGPDTPTTSASAQGARLELVATHDESTIPGLDFPGYMAFDSQGQLYVVNAGTSEILVLDSAGRVARRWGEWGTRPGQLDFRRDSNPNDPIGGIAVAADGSVYVVESGTRRVQHLTAKGRPLASWGTKGQKNGQFLEPIGVAVAPSGEVFVVDDRRDDIQVFSADGTYRRTIGGQGSAPGQLRDTGNIRIDGEGNLVNADFGNGRVQAWDDKGQLLWTLGSPGTGPGQFTEPEDVAFGPDGSLLVVDNGRVQVFDAQRDLVGVWPADPSPDQLGAVAVDGDRVWVATITAKKLFELKVSRTS